MKLDIIFAATVSILLASGCSGVTTSAPPNTAPKFAGTVPDRSYIVGSITCTLDLPEASGGNGGLIYSLSPRVPPGWHFDETKRTLAVPTTTSGAWELTYRVDDSDEDTSDSDTDNLTFSITIAQPSTDIEVPEGGVSSEYQGCGNQVFFLNPDGGGLDDTTYTLELREAAATVYLIATNTTTGNVTPHIEQLDDGGEVVPNAVLQSRDRQPTPVSTKSPLARIIEFNNTPPSIMMAGVTPSGVTPSGVTGQPQRAEHPPPVAVGDRYTFIGYDFGEETDVEVVATARTIVSNGTVTLAVWVADVDWGACPLCVRQKMVDALADGFVRPGDDNDIYDWITAIFGDPWGPHESPYLIPAGYAEQIHILIYDIDDDGLEGYSPSGYFPASSAYLRSSLDFSNERLMFVVDAPRLADQWEPDRFYSLLAHEFQHMINFYEKVVTYDIPAETWINEMCSEMAEDFVADKIQTDGPRRVDHDDPTAGDSEIEGLLSIYNYYNYVQASRWEYDAPLFRYYAINYALGAYLARSYGGAPLFGAIVRSDQTGVDAIEAALASQGHSIEFEDVLTDWAVANVLSDDTQAPFPYRYNSGTWSTSYAGGITFRLGSINLFNYRYRFDEESGNYHDGPYFFPVSDFNNQGEQPPHSNRYAALGLNTGTVRLQIVAAPGNRITVVVKE